MTIPQSAVDAAKQMLLSEGCLDQEHYPGYQDAVVTVALEVAMPRIRKQIADEIRAEAAKRAGTAGWDTAFHNLGLVTAARIAENGPGQ